MGNFCRNTRVQVKKIHRDGSGRVTVSVSGTWAKRICQIQLTDLLPLNIRRSKIAEINDILKLCGLSEEQTADSELIKTEIEKADKRWVHRITYGQPKPDEHCYQYRGDTPQGQVDIQLKCMETYNAFDFECTGPNAAPKESKDLDDP